MQTKKALAIIGTVLIVIQLLSFVGMSRMYVGLYPDRYDLLYPTILDSGKSLNAKKLLFAIEAGVDRFKSGFEDLTHSKDEYRVMTATQMTSAMIRESLDCSYGGSTGLTIYDIVLTISYCITGIIGVFLLILGVIAHRKGEQNKPVAEEKVVPKEPEQLPGFTIPLSVIMPILLAIFVVLFVVVIILERS